MKARQSPAKSCFTHKKRQDWQIAMLPSLSSLDVGMPPGVVLPEELAKMIEAKAALPVVVTASVSLVDTRDRPAKNSYPLAEEARFVFTCATPDDEPALNSEW